MGYARPGCNRGTIGEWGDIMDEPSAAQKWATVIVMAAVAAAVATGVFTHIGLLRQSAAENGFGQSISYAWVAGAILVTAFVAWLGTLLVCGLIQRSSSVWLGGPFFGVLAIVGLTAGFAGPEVPDTLAQIHYRWLRTPAEKTLEATRQTFATQTLNDRLRCDLDMGRLGFPDFLHPASLGAPKGFERARDKIKKARDIAHACQDRDASRIAAYRKTLAGLDVPPAAKAEAEALASPSQDADRAQVYADMNAIINEAETTLDDLAQHRSRWYTDADRLMFYNQNDLKTFQLHAQVIESLARDAEPLDQKLLAAERKAALPQHP